jgi:hypothetical protein
MATQKTYISTALGDYRQTSPTYDIVKSWGESAGGEIYSPARVATTLHLDCVDLRLTRVSNKSDLHP